jgi:hypothetical protein
LNRNKLYNYFQAHHSPIIPIDDLFVCRCPICGKPKFILNFRYLTGKCLNGCFNGFLIDVISIYHDISYNESQELIDSMDPQNTTNVDKEDKQAKIVLPSYQTKTVLTRTTYLTQEYLRNKNLDLDYLDRLGMGFDGVRIIIPLRCRGVLVSYISVGLNGNVSIQNSGSSRNSEWLFNEEALFLQDKIYLTSDWLEAATMGPEGVASKLPVLGTIQKNNTIKSQIEQIVIIPADYPRALRMTRTLMKFKKVKLLDFSWFEKNRIGSKPSEVGKENILQLEANTPWMTDKFLFQQNKVLLDKRIELKK